MTPPRAPRALVDTARNQERTRRRWGLAGTDGSADDATRQMPVLPLLDELADLLAQETIDGEQLSRFDRYRLTDWLTSQRLRPAQEKDDRANIVRLLREWVSGNQPQNGDAAIKTMDLAPDIWSRRWSGVSRRSAGSWTPAGYGNGCPASGWNDAG